MEFSSSYQALQYLLADPNKECKNEKLKLFSKLHYTYINQFFGDLTVREMIMEVFPSKTYVLSTIPGTGVFSETNHHIVYDKEKKPICSVLKEQQNLKIDKHDTLCQTYSLLNYLILQQKEMKTQSRKRTRTKSQKRIFFIDFLKDYDEVPRDKYEKHILMLRVYLVLLNNPFLNRIFQFELEHPYRTWNDFILDNDADDKRIFVAEASTEDFLNSIKGVLALWLVYGYQFFITKGDCQRLKERFMIETKDVMSYSSDLDELSQFLEPSSQLDLPRSSSTRKKRKRGGKTKKNKPRIKKIRRTLRK